MIELQNNVPLLSTLCMLHLSPTLNPHRYVWQPSAVQFNHIHIKPWIISFLLQPHPILAHTFLGGVHKYTDCYEIIPTRWISAIIFRQILCKWFLCAHPLQSWNHHSPTYSWQGQAKQRYDIFRHLAGSVSYPDAMSSSRWRVVLHNSAKSNSMRSTYWVIKLDYGDSWCFLGRIQFYYRWNTKISSSNSSWGNNWI